MSEVKALEKLRKLTICDKGEKYTAYLDAGDIADEIEAEISERFIALPVDEEGDVLRIGDELKCQDKSILLNSLSWDGRRWYATETVISSGWYPAHLCRHVQRTLEDVLRDYWCDEGSIKRCADEIRAMFDEVDHGNA